MTIFLFSLAGIPPLGGLVRQVRHLPGPRLGRHHLGLRPGRHRRRQLGDRLRLLRPAAAHHVVRGRPRRRHDAPSRCRPRSPRPSSSPSASPSSSAIVPERGHPLHRPDQPPGPRQLGRRPAPAAHAPARPRRAARRWAGGRRSPTFVDLALYDPADGFYAAGGRAGRRGDFLTSPEVGPAVRRRGGPRLDDTWWDELGRPDPFVVVEAGAGPGHPGPLGAGGRAGVRARRSPTCSSSAAPRSGRSTPSTCRAGWASSTASAWPRFTRPTPRAGARAALRVARRAARRRSVGRGDRQRAARQPAVRRRAPHRRRAPSELTGRRGRRRARPRGRAGRRRASAPCSPVSAVPPGVLGPVAAAGPALAGRRRWPASSGAAWWSSTTARPTAELAAPAGDGLAAHLPGPRARAAIPLDAPGTQDITAEVAVDQLQLDHPATRVRTQAELPARPSASTSWSTRAGGSGPSGPTPPTSRPCGPAAGSARPRRSPIPTGLAPSVVLEWDVGALGRLSSRPVGSG